VLQDNVIGYLFQFTIGLLFQSLIGVPIVIFCNISYRIFILGCGNTVADFIAPFVKNLASKMQSKCTC